MPKVDVLIIGAGPAGMNAARVIKELRPETKIALVDLGSRNPEDFETPTGRVTGPGGAGGTSDGKFSFGDSATRLKQVMHFEESMKETYNWLRENYNMPEVKDLGKGYGSAEPMSKWFVKRYESVYIGLEDRMRMIRDCVAAVDDSLSFYDCRAEIVEKLGDEYHVVAKSLKTSNSHFLFSKTLIFAGGRFGPMTRMPWPQTFRRTEVGVRLEMPLSAVPAEFEGLKDPKAKFHGKNEDVERRVFCYCRDGEVVETVFPSESGPIATYSGHSDCAPTGKVNHGINVRYRNAWDSPRISSLQLFSDDYDRMGCFLRLFPMFGGKVASDILDAVSEFLKNYKIPHDQIKVYGPVIEGVGSYPTIDSVTLRFLGDDSAWVAGDSTGIFRGIVAALVSGNCVAKQVVEHLDYGQD